MPGPTLNPIYNDVLKRWGVDSDGEDCKPECEECGGDLTGKDVHETSWGWVGDCCWTEDDAEDGDRHYSLDDWRTRRAEAGWGE